MAGKYLGDEFDIHGGGLDLRFPHHENELAQSTAAGQRFARFWMHNAWVTAAGEKMSKSLGNGALVSEVVQRYPARAVRFYLAQPHYRSAIEFSDTSLDEADRGAGPDRQLRRPGGGAGGPTGRASVPDAFAAAMDDDLGTPGAVAVLYQAVRDGNTALAAGDDGDGDRTAGRGAGDAGRPRSGRGGPDLAARRRRRPAGDGRRRSGRARCSSSGPRLGSGATSPPRTRCVTPCTTWASPSPTPRPDRAGPWPTH